MYKYVCVCVCVRISIMHSPYRGFVTTRNAPVYINMIHTHMCPNINNPYSFKQVRDNMRSAYTHK